MQEVDRVVAVGSGFVAAGLTGEPGRLHLVSWTSGEGRSWRRWPEAATVGVSRVTSLAAGDGTHTLLVVQGQSRAEVWARESSAG